MLGTLGLAALHVAVQGRAPGPWLPDEVAYLRGADTLSGGAPPLLDGVPYYRWGYSALLAPVQELRLDLADRFLAVTTVNAVLLALVFPLVRLLLLRAAGATRREATIGALVAALLPVAWAYGGFALSEPLLLALVPAWLLTVHASSRRGRPTASLLAATLALYASHQRLAICLIVVVALLVDLARRSPAGTRVRTLLPAVAVLAGGVLAVHLVDAWMEATRWHEVTRPEEADGGVVGLLTRPGSWDRLAGIAIGHGWQVVVSGGVALVAGIAFAGRSVPPGHGQRAGMVTGRAAIALLGLLAVSSAAFLAIGGSRPDQLVYGRYLEVALPPLVGWGVVAVLRADRVVVPAAMVTIAATLAGSVALATLPWTAALRDHRVPVLHAPSLTLLTDGTGPLQVGRATAVTVGLAALVGLATHLRGLPRTTLRRIGVVAMWVWLATVVVLDLARSTEVVREGRAAHIRAEARR